MDSEEPVAFGKAIAEALERFAVDGFENPWATAAYLDFDGASARAYFELAGIDRALCHHYCRTRFNKLDISVLSGRFRVGQIKKMLDRYGLEAGFYELRPTRDAKICTMMAWPKGQAKEELGFVNGYGCSGDITVAATSAAYECLRTAAAVYLGGARPERPLSTFNQPGNPWFHFWANQTAASINYFRKYLMPLKDPGEVLPPESLSVKDVRIGRITTLDNAFPGIPLVVAQAVSEKFIKPQFGPIRMDPATERRLLEFCGRRVVPEAQVPHFYG